MDITAEDLEPKHRGYVLAHKAWYAAPNRITLPRITFGLYPGGGNEGTVGEMELQWQDFGPGHPPAPLLRVYSDAFVVLRSFQDLLTQLPELGEDFSPDQFVTLLDALGFRDLTAYEYR